MTATVLFVDDESMVLQALRRALRSQPIDWDLRFCDTVDGALELLENDPVDVVVTDMQMPGINGADFLARAKALQPDTVRLVLSGFKDKAVAFQTTSAHRLLVKPIMCTSLVQQINAALEGIGPESVNRRLVTETGLLPTTRSALADLRATLTSSTARVHDVVGLALNDPVLAVKLLQLGNSGLFGQRPAGTDLADCVSAIGMDTLRELVESLSIAYATDDDVQDGRIAALQEHARSAAVDKTGAESLGALVHVVGSLLTLETEASPTTSLPACADHAGLTQSLLQLWGVPTSVVDAAGLPC